MTTQCHSSGDHVLLQNEPAFKLKTDHEFQPTEVKNIPARCEICKKKVRVVGMITAQSFLH